MRRAGTAMAAVLLAAVVGCSGAGSGTTAGNEPTSPRPSKAGADGCPVIDSSGGFAAVDYVDFVQAFGRQYVAGTYSSRTVGAFLATATRADLGRVVLRSRCSFSEFNDRTHHDPGEPRDGDTGFLPAGTPIYSLHGWSTRCRLAAKHDGDIHVYLAYRNGTPHAKPRACALGHPV